LEVGISFGKDLLTLWISFVFGYYIIAISYYIIAIHTVDSCTADS